MVEECDPEIRSALLERINYREKLSVYIERIEYIYIYIDKCDLEIRSLHFQLLPNIENPKHLSII